MDFTNSLHYVLQCTIDGVLQCAAVCCSALECIVSVMQCAATCCGVLQCVVVCCSVLRCVAAPFCKNDPQNCKCAAVSCSALQFVAMCCSTPFQK